jgi:endonuclease/exonuclease/phosphatase family metal-dependent hydrolase
MNKILYRIAAVLLLTCFNSFQPKLQTNVRVCSWNLKDFGRTKSDGEIEFIANTLKNFDIVLIQEVVAKDPGGAQAVGRLGDALNRTGAKWEYRISDATSGDSPHKRERYAFLWKTSEVILLGKPWLEIKYNIEMDREPFLATFKKESQVFTLVNFHAITKSAQPETEVKYFKFFPLEYPDLNLVFCGDFNLPQSHTVFSPLKKMGYTSALVHQKTSLKEEAIGDDCLASEFDNFFYDSKKIEQTDAGIIPFYQSFANLKEAQKISDHVPVYLEFSVK